MKLQDSILTLNSSTPIDDVEEIKAFLLENIKDISTIEVEFEDDMLTGALVLLLFALRKSYPEVAIPLFDSALPFGTWGSQQWRHNG